MDSVAQRTLNKTHTVNSLFWTPEWDKVRNEQHTTNHEANVKAFREFAKKQGFEMVGNWFGTAGKIKAVRIKK